MADGAARLGRAWGLGCWTLGAAMDGLDAGALLSTASAMAAKSASSPKSSSMMIFS